MSSTGFVPFKQWERMWRNLSLRWQILLVYLVGSLMAGTIASVLVIYNARTATLVEINAATSIAARHIAEIFQRHQHYRTAQQILADIRVNMGSMRHMKLHVEEADGTMVPVTIESDDDSDYVPHWFYSLIDVQNVSHRFMLPRENGEARTLILTGDEKDEIAEVWHDTVDLAMIASILNLSVFLFLYASLGRVLEPLSRVAAGLQRLEQGEYKQLLPPPGVRDLEEIVAKFNQLSDHLAKTTAEKHHLARQLITAQDDERRVIANDLHDELGPCLFGLKANLASLERIAEDLPKTEASSVQKRLTILGDITEQIRIMNRRLLSKMRPIMLGDASLAETISGLIAEFERHGTEIGFHTKFEQIAGTYDDVVNLTIYRCVQEGITNALRHAKPHNVNIAIEQHRSTSPNRGSGGTGARLSISVIDDGIGIEPNRLHGFGLNGMKERVHALGGKMKVGGNPGGGTRLQITLPLERSYADAIATQ